MVTGAMGYYWGDKADNKITLPVNGGKTTVVAYLFVTMPEKTGKVVIKLPFRARPVSLNLFLTQLIGKVRLNQKACSFTKILDIE